MFNCLPFAPTRARSRNNVSSKNPKWTPEEDSLLREIVGDSQTTNWKATELKFPGKTSQQIFERWNKVLNPLLHKGSWTRHEDELIIRHVQGNGCRGWAKLAKLLPGRIGKQCRERWFNHLDPQISHGPWTQEEDQILLNLHEQYGNSWSKIASQMPTRSDNMIKNRWYSTLTKRCRGIENVDEVSVNEKVEEAEPIRVENSLPQPILEIPIQSWTPLLISPVGLGPIPLNVTPTMKASLELVSPTTPGQSPFGMISPFSNSISMMNPWGDFPKMLFTSSPSNAKSPPLSLIENRAELVNLIVNQ
jgi:hypothetical protein